VISQQNEEKKLHKRPLKALVTKDYDSLLIWSKHVNVFTWSLAMP
jgi:hypothetical protein